MNKDICCYQERNGITKRAANLAVCKRDIRKLFLNFMMFTAFKHFEVFHSMHFHVLDVPSITRTKCALYICYICVCWFTTFLQWQKSYVLLAILYVTRLKTPQLISFLFFSICNAYVCVWLWTAAVILYYIGLWQFVLRASNYTWVHRDWSL